MRRAILLCCLFALICHITSRRGAAAIASEITTPAWSPVATFSILGYDPDTGEVGGAVQSRVFCVGNGVIWAEAEVGAVATQSMADIGYGPQALALLKKGIAPDEVVKQVWDADPDPQPRDWSKQGRQLAVINMPRAKPRPSPARRTLPGPATKSARIAPPKATFWPAKKSCTKWSRASRRPRGIFRMRLLGGARRGPIGRRRQTRHAIGLHDHRQEKRRPVAAQRHRAAAASRRQPRADQRTPPPGRKSRPAKTCSPGPRCRRQVVHLK